MPWGNISSGVSHDQMQAVAMQEAAALKKKIDEAQKYMSTPRITVPAKEIMPTTDLDLKAKTAAGKVPLELFPLKTVWGASRVFGYGTKKYKRGNWAKCAVDLATDRYVAAALRHLSEVLDSQGVALDDESGLPHLDHAICSLVMLRGILQQNGKLPIDPGEGKEPPSLFRPSRTRAAFSPRETYTITSPGIAGALRRQSLVEGIAKAVQPVVPPKPVEPTLYCPVVAATGSQAAFSGRHPDLCDACGNWKSEHKATL